MTSFVKRALSLKFQLGQGAFGEEGFDTVTLEGLRVSAAIQNHGGVSYQTASLQVYGASQSVMDSLTLLGQKYPDLRKNQVTVMADGTVAFQGQIQEAYLDMANAPQGVFTVSAQSSALDAIRPLPPASFPGPVDAADVVAGIAIQMRGHGFENSGVSVQLAAGLYLWGTATQQLETIARKGNFNATIDSAASPPVVSIWPKDGTRGGQIPLISPESGLVGYPAYVQNAIKFTVLYNPNIRIGGAVDVQSSVKNAVGRWNVYDVSHMLESETPDGKWFTDIKAIKFGADVPSAR